MVPSMINMAIPVSAGVIAGAFVPKMFSTPIANTPWLKYVIQGATGVVGYIAGKPLMGSKNAVLFSGAVMATMVISLMDDLVIGPATGDKVLGDIPQYTIQDNSVVDELSDVPGTDDVDAISANEDYLMETGMDVLED